MAASTPIFVAQTTNETVVVTSERLNGDNNQRPTLYVTGVFGGATVAFNISVDGVNFLPLQNGSFSAPGYVDVNANANFVQGVITGATGTTNITAELL